MSTIIGLLISVTSTILHFVASLDLSITSQWLIHQPKAPKSLLK